MNVFLKNPNLEDGEDSNLSSYTKNSRVKPLGEASISA